MKNNQEKISFSDGLAIIIGGVVLAFGISCFFTGSDEVCVKQTTHYHLAGYYIDYGTDIQKARSLAGSQALYEVKVCDIYQLK